MKQFKMIIIAVMTSWWFIGTLGWVIVLNNYPLEDILPRYAE